MVQDFTFVLPTRVIFGAGTVASVGREAALYGTRAVLVTGTAFARRSGLIDRITRALADSGIAVTIYDDIGPNPQVDAIDRGGMVAREAGAEFVVGLGGGSALDAAKAIALAAVTDGSVWDLVRTGGDPISKSVQRALPTVQIPLIASTGSETNDVSVLFHQDLQIKATIEHALLYPRVAIVDPTLTFTVPPHYTAVGGMNIASQMLERYLTSDEFPVTDRIAEGLIRVVMDSLPRAMRRGEDLDARNNLSWAAVLASTVAIAGRSGSAPLRAMAHPLSAHYGVEHGCAVAALWPSFIRYALGNRLRLPQIGRFKRYALLGRQIFGVHETDDEVAAEITAHRLSGWLRSVDMPTDLLELGIESLEPSEVTRLADQVISVAGTGGRLAGGMAVQDVEHVYDGALRHA